MTKAFAINGKLERSDASTAYERYVVRNKRAIAALDAIGDHKNLVRIKPDRLLCDSFEKSRCVAHLDGAPLYFDDDHLSNEGSRLVVAEIAKHVSGGKNVAFVSRADQ